MLKVILLIIYIATILGIVFLSAKTLTYGKAHYRALFKDIKTAEDCIYVLFLTIHHDIAGEDLAKALIEKAKKA